jgi:DNA-binding GntR family transcriptional regulator
MAKRKRRAPSIGEARVYRELKHAITGGLLRAGTGLVQEDLCKQFRASRTPVRDALTHLQAEGLVVALPNKGVVVRDCTPKEVHDIYEIRVLLESAAAKNAVSRITRADLEAIILRAKELEAQRNFVFSLIKDVGTDLHRLIIAASGNSIMKDLLNRMETLIEVSRIPFHSATIRLREINKEHIEIAQALLKGNGELAASLMTKHLLLTEEAHLKILLGTSYGSANAVNQR